MQFPEYYKSLSKCFRAQFVQHLFYSITSIRHHPIPFFQSKHPNQDLVSSPMKKSLSRKSHIPTESELRNKEEKQKLISTVRHLANKNKVILVLQSNIFIRKGSSSMNRYFDIFWCLFNRIDDDKRKNIPFCFPELRYILHDG